jgi:hypothetical protein
MEKEKQESKQKLLLNLSPIKTRIMKVIVESMPNSSYIQHRLDPSIVADFTKRETGEKDKKKLRNFDKEYELCFYYTSNKKHGVPVSAFTSAILDSCVALNIQKTTVKRAIRLLGDIAEIKYKKINRRIDNPRRSGRNSTPDVRHRPEFIDWNVELIIQYDEDQVTPEQIINLINAAGFTSGIGDWRPSAPKSCGTHGMFRVSVK